MPVLRLRAHRRRDCHSPWGAVIIVYCALIINLNAVKLNEPVKCTVYNSYPSDVPPAGVRHGKEKKESPPLTHLLLEITFVPFPHILCIPLQLGLGLEPAPARLRASCKATGLRHKDKPQQIFTCRRWGVCLVQHLSFCTKGLRICVCKGEGTWETNILCSNFFPFSGEGRKSSLTLVKMAGPAVDLVPKHRTSYYLPSRVNFNHSCSPKSGQSPSILPGGFPHILRYTICSKSCVYRKGLTPILFASFPCQIFESSLVHMVTWLCICQDDSALDVI